MALGKTMKLIFIVFCVYILTLFFREQRFPAYVSDKLAAAVSTSNIVVNCESLSVGFRRGVHLSGIRVFDRESKRDLEPILSVGDVSIHPFSRKLQIIDLKYPRLPDSYYEPVESNRVAAGANRDAWKEWRLPKLSRFDCELIRPEILGVAPKSVNFGLNIQPRRLTVADAVVVWSTVETPMSLVAECEVDLEHGRVVGHTSGTTLPIHFRPLMLALDLPFVLPYYDAFTGVVGPVPASYEWDAGLSGDYFKMELGLHPLLGRYNGVPLRSVDGGVSLDLKFVEAEAGMLRKDYVTRIGPLVAADRRGGALEGFIDIISTNDMFSLAFDAKSTLPFVDNLDIIGYFNDGTLDFIKCKTPPWITIDGILRPNDGERKDSDFKCKFALEEGEIFKIPLVDIGGEFNYRDNFFNFTSLNACGVKGGKLHGVAKVYTPEANETTPPWFALNFEYTDGHLGELQGIGGIDLGERYGDINGKIELSGPLGEDCLAGLNGNGSFRIENGHIAQMKLFLGLTEVLSEYVPGVASIVNQTRASADYVITNGVIQSSNILIEGSLISIRAEGSYDMVNDNLDFEVRVRLMKDESLLGKYLIRPITWPFAKLLLEYKVQGKIEDPEWTYISILDRI